MTNQPEPTLRAKIMNSLWVGASPAINIDQLDKIMVLFQAHEEATVREAEIALARKVLSVSNYSIRHKGITMRDRLDILTKRMSAIIPDIFGIEEKLTHPQAGKPLTDEEVTKVSLCPTCYSVTHTHQGVCTRCGELKDSEAKDICTCDCHTQQGAAQDNHCSLC